MPVCCQKFLKQGQEPRTKFLRFSVLSPHMSCNTSTNILLQQNNTVPNYKGEAAECIQLFTKRMSEAKGRHQEQTAKTHR